MIATTLQETAAQPKNDPVAENATTVAKQAAGVFAEQLVRVILPPSGDQLLA